MNEYIINILFLGLAVLIVGLLLFLIRIMLAKKNDNSEVEEPQLITVLKNDIAELKNINNNLQQRNIVLERSDSELSEKVKHIEELDIKIKILEDEKDKLIIIKTELMTENAKLKEKIKTDEGLQEQFRNLSNSILQEQSRNINLQNKETLENVINPIQKTISEFQKKIDEANLKNISQYTALREQLINLQNVSTNLQIEAQSLTKALKGDNKIQGDWGEMILQRCLEHSGLRKDIEYFVQNSFKDDDNKNSRPDVIIKLPDGKNIIIDSKVSLKAWVDYQNSENEVVALAKLKSLEISLKNHINNLASKNYHELAGVETISNVLMFIPIEAAIFNKDLDTESIINLSLKNNITIVTPTTLFSVLRLIHYFWQFDVRNKNANEVIKLAEDAVKRFDTFLGRFEEIEKTLKNLSKKTEDARKSLDGKQGLRSPLGKIAAKYLIETSKNGNYLEENKDEQDFQEIE